MGENEGKERVRDCRGQQRIKLDLPWTRLADITGAFGARLQRQALRFFRTMPHQPDRRQKIAGLAAGETRVWPLVQFLQVGERILRQLLGVVLPGGGELVDVLDGFLSGLRNPGRVQFAIQSIGFQYAIDNFVHAKLLQYFTIQ
jgi:hypothetical protein